MRNHGKKIIIALALTISAAVGAPQAYAAELMCSPATEGIDAFIDATMYLAISVDGGPDDCPARCRQFSQNCHKYAASQNRCVATIYKNYLKLYDGACKTIADPVQKKECRDQVDEMESEVKEELDQNTVEAEAICDQHIDDCMQYCEANS